MTGEASAEARLGEQIATAARTPGDVVDLSPGPFGTVSTPVPGGRVDGVAVRPDSVEVGVVIRWGRSIPEITAEVRAAVAPLAGGREIHVVVDDMVDGAPPDGPA